MRDFDERTLDALLRREFDATTADDGFSERVMLSLPPRRPQRTWLLPAATLAGGLLAWASLSRLPLWQLAVDEWGAGQPGGAAVLAGAVGLAAGLLACGWAMSEAD